MKPTLTLLFFALLFLLSAPPATPQYKEILGAEPWKDQALTTLIPRWYEHARDTTHGAFFMSLTRSWRPAPPWDKYPAMISRQVYGFSAAYLLSGEEKYLDVARDGAKYLLKRAWDKEYGGWFNVLTQTGEVKDSTKSVDLQLYTNVGLALYCFVTGDEQVLARIKESIRIQKTYALDKELGGYFQTLNRDLTVRDSAKSKHGHYGYTSSLLIDLYMFTRDPEILSFAEELMQISMERMTDPQEDWLRGFPNRFDRQWNFSPIMTDGHEMISVGAQLTGTLAFLRLYEITGKEVYRKEGLELAEKLTHYGWDSTRGGWYEMIERNTPYRVQGTPRISWWIQCYGDFLQLHLYHITGQGAALNRFAKSAGFWNRYFVDKEYGGVFQTVSADGTPIDTMKAVVWKASYHEMEHALLNYLYLSLYVHHKPATLHFLLHDVKPHSKHFVSLAEDPSVQIGAVKVNGKAWKDFDAKERWVRLPGGAEVRLEVALVAAKR